RDAKFDLYHAGIPWVRELGVIGKTFPNVWLNLCWCHVISQEMARSALDEWIDLMPITKIIGFGGDYSIPVEKIYGHLVMAKEDIAEVLARRISRGLMKRSEALEIARMWFYENPVELYGLKLS
ncbi:MAG: amidohydrolase, partial [Candidatus Bathyarchaeia archaeon]